MAALFARPSIAILTRTSTSGPSGTPEAKYSALWSASTTHPSPTSTFAPFAPMSPTALPPVTTARSAPRSVALAATATTIQNSLFIIFVLCL